MEDIKGEETERRGGRTVRAASLILVKWESQMKKRSKMKQQAAQQAPKSIKGKEACFSLLKVGHFFLLL